MAKDIEAEAKTKICHRTINGKREDLQPCMVERCARWVTDRGCMDNLVFVRPEIPEVSRGL